MLRKNVGWTGNKTGVPDLAKIRMLHVHIVDEYFLETLKNSSVRTIELDISSGDDGKYYIGHHESFYKNKGLDFPPCNVSIERAMKFVVEYGFFTKLDCKDKKAVSKVAELAQRLGPDHCMLHAYIKEFDYQSKEREPYWDHESITLEEIIKLQARTGYPRLQVSCRGFVQSGVASPEDSDVSNLFEVCAVAKENKIDVVNLNLLGNQVPPDWVLRYFCDNGILLEAYEDNIKDRQLPCDVFTTIEIE